MRYFLLQRLSDPEIEPVTLAEAKKHIKQFANVTNEDDYIEGLIKLAREWVEWYTGCAMVDQSWRVTFSRHQLINGNSVAGYIAPGYMGSVYGQSLINPARMIYLRRSPVLAITRVATVDAYGVETEVSADEYSLIDEGTKWPRIIPAAGATWTGTDFRVEYRAGFADRTGSPVTGAEVVPPALKHAIKLVLANFDANREPVNVGNIVNKMPLGLEWLLAQHKCDQGWA
jgi:hypothetical protein